MNRRDVLTGLAATLCLPLAAGEASASSVMCFADGRSFVPVAPADVLNPSRCLLEPRWPGPREAWQEAAASGKSAFYSLMVEKGLPEITLHVAGDTMQLVTPPPRTRLDARFAPHIRAFLERTGLHLSRVMAECGIIEAGGRYHDVFNLPEGLQVEGRLSLSHMPVSALPDGLTVEGSLDVSYTALARLPERLKVGGDLSVSGTQIAALPPSAEVGGIVYGLPGRPVWLQVAGDDIILHDGRPWYYQAANLNACERRHLLGGTWHSLPVTDPRYAESMRWAREVYEGVKQACANGTDTYLP